MNVTRREIGLALLTVGAGCVALNLSAWPRREQGEQNEWRPCYSNITGIGLGLMQYAQDNDDTLPRAWFGRDAGPSGARGNYKWMDAVLPYVKNPAAFTCPADSISAPYRERSGRSYGSYVLNNAYFAPGDAQSPPAGRKLSEIADYNTILLLDGENDFQFSWPDAARTPPLEGSDPFHLGSITGRHGSGLYQTTTYVDVGGMSSTGLLNYARTTRILNGRKIYPMLTIEADSEPYHAAK